MRSNIEKNGDSVQKPAKADTIKRCVSGWALFSLHVHAPDNLQASSSDALNTDLSQYATPLKTDYVLTINHCLCERPTCVQKELGVEEAEAAYFIVFTSVEYRTANINLPPFDAIAATFAVLARVRVDAKLMGCVLRAPVVAVQWIKV